LTDSYCDDGSPVSAIVLDPGETVICTFEDTRRGGIVVRKVTDPSPDLSNASFGFTAGGGLTPTGFSLGDGDSRSFGNLLPTDGYNVDETTIPSGWSLTTATCDDGSPVSNIDVAPGETVTCTFYNEATPVCIEIVKDGASCAHPGEEIIYSFKVHNCSDFDLENVTVTDPLWDPDLVELVGSLAADDGAAGGPDEYSFNEPYTVPSVFSGDLMPNTATVEGTDVLGRTVNDNDGHVVEILHPCIDVTKTHLPSKRANGDFLPGDKVTYVFKVTNCSSSTDLNNVTVVDEWVPPSPDSGQRFSKNLGSLGAGSNKGFSWVYTIPKDIDVEQNDVLVNRVTAFGVDDCDGTVDDAATDRVGLGQPRVHVPEWDSILLLASGLGPLAAYASMRFRKRR
jgi:uncharacterized repeat protein (TIGR01451 family)